MHLIRSTRWPPLDDKLAEWEIANLEEQFSNLAREAGFSPPAPPTGMKAGRATLATRLRSADWRYAAFAGSLLAASIGVAAWWWSSHAAYDDDGPLQLRYL